MKQRLGIFLIVFFVCSELKAQEQSTAYELGYQVSFPSGKFADFSGNTSWAGFSLSGRKYIKQVNRLSLGSNLNWFYFAEKKGRETVNLSDKGTYTGEVRSYTNIYGLLFLAQYDLKDAGNTAIPFVRAGLGTAAQYQHKNIGLFTASGDGIQFYFNMEAGVRLSQNKDKGVNLSVTYNNMPGTSDLIDTQFWGVKLSVLFQK